MTRDNPTEDQPPNDPQAAPADAASEERRALIELEREIAAKIERRLPPDGAAIPPIELARILAEIVSVEIRSSFQGPLPPPTMLANYEEVAPGLALRIVGRADKEQEFRHEIMLEQAAQERLRITFAGRSKYMGQIFAFVIAMTIVGGGIGLLFAGHDTAGLVAIIGALVALVAVFITGRALDASQEGHSEPAASRD